MTVEIATLVFALVPLALIGAVVYVAVRLAIRHESRRKE